MALFDVTHRNPGGHEGALETETAAQQESHQVIVPIGPDILSLDEGLSVSPDPVEGDVGADIRAGGRDPGLPDAGFHDFEHGTGLRVVDAKEQEFEGQASIQDDEIGLGKGRSETAGGSSPLPSANAFPDFTRWG